MFPRASSCWRKHTAPEPLRWTHPKHVSIPSNFFIYLVTCTYSLQAHRLPPSAVCITRADTASEKGCSKEGVNLSLLWEVREETKRSVCLLLCKGQQHRNTEIFPQALLCDGTKEERLHVNNFRKLSAADWKWSNSTHKRIKHHFLSWSAEFSYLSSSRSSEEMPSLRSKLQILDKAMADDSTTEEQVKVYE